MNNSKIPGSTSVIKTFGGNGFRCTECEKDINPLMIEDEGMEIPVCEDCFLDEIIKDNCDISEVELIDSLSAAIGDHDITMDEIKERELWEGYCC